MSKTGYAKQQGVALGVQNPRQTEAHALVEIARRMDEVRRDETSSGQKKAEMFTLNWRLWTIFQSELSNPDNPLPDMIKANMLQLANFIDKHTISEMRNPSNAGLAVLININRQVAAGLMGDGGEGLDEAQGTRLAIIREDVSKVPAKRKSTEKKDDAAKKPNIMATAPSAAPAETDVFANLGKPSKPRFTTKKVD